MKRFLGLWRDTWLMWIVLLTGGVLAGAFIKAVFFFTIPISMFSFFYFGWMRYDEDGSHRVIDE